VSGFGALDAVRVDKFFRKDFPILNKKNLQVQEELGDFHGVFEQCFY
jgi:hypothetical protein